MTSFAIVLAHVLALSEKNIDAKSLYICVWYTFRWYYPSEWVTILTFI